MLELVPHDIENYARVHTSREDPLLHELAAYTEERVELPQMLTGNIEGTFLRLLVRAIGARRILEIGTYTGYSALAMAMGLPDDGKVITCDINPEFTAIAQRFWARSSHGAKIDLRLGPAQETLELLEGPFDLVFIDADKENYVNYWDRAVPLTRLGGLLIADNVLWDGRVLDPQEKTDHAIVAFNERVRYDGRVELVMLTLRDGVTVAQRLR